MSITPQQEALIRTAVGAVGQMLDTEAKVVERLIEPLAGKAADLLFTDPKMHADMVAAGKQLHGMVDRAIHTAEVGAPVALNNALNMLRDRA